MAKREDIEDVIRMAVRVTARYRKEGIVLNWSMKFDPPVLPPTFTTTSSGRRTKTVRATVNRGTVK